MTGWRMWPNFDFVNRDVRWEEPRLSSYWLPEPMSIVTVPQPHRRADPLAAESPLGGAGRPASRGRLASAAAVPDTIDWLTPTLVLIALCLAVKWWSDRR